MEIFKNEVLKQHLDKEYEKYDLIPCRTCISLGIPTYPFYDVMLGLSNNIYLLYDKF